QSLVVRLHRHWGEVKIRQSGIDHGCRSSPGIVIVASNHGGIALHHLADRAEMMVEVEILACRTQRALRIGEQCHRIVGVAKFSVTGRVARKSSCRSKAAALIPKTFGT